VADRSSGLGKPRVYYDNVKIARLAAGHFLQRGFKHVAYLNIGNYWHEVERIPTIRQTVCEAGGLFHEIAFLRHPPGPADSPAAGFAAAHAWLAETVAKLPKPLGIVTSTDDDAARLLQACDDAGIAVPEEVAVLGCDNDALLCDHAPVPLSSVDINWERIGYEASVLLGRLMDGGAAPAAPILIPPKGVVTRQSTDILAIPDARIARALRFIWQNFTQQIGRPEVAAAAGLDRRKLDHDFPLHLHRSVSDEIQRVRIEYAKKLLLETDRKINDIGWASGFFDAAHFSKAFVRATGTRPGAFRRRNVAGAPE
jgi:LacI family transcriptional regulator